MKKIIILGAGIYQVPLIHAAKKMGLYVIVISIAGEYPGFALADKVYEVSTTDKEQILHIARQEGISAIVTTGTDVAVSTIGYVCDALSLPGISYESAKVVTDKALMKEAFSRNNVTTAKHQIIHSIPEALEAFQEIGAPAILKIVDKSGSRGITRVETETQLREAYIHAQKYTDADYMVLEQFIVGHEVGIDAFVQDGKMLLFVPHDKLMYQTDRTGIPLGHICPASISESLFNTMKGETEKAIRATQLDNCAINLDVLVTSDNEVYVIEIAGRCGATGIPEVISGYLGIDYYEIIIKNALGEKIHLVSNDVTPTASALLFSPKTGILHSVDYVFNGTHYCNQDSIREASGYIQLDYAPGTKVHVFENGTHRIGQAILSNKSLSDLLMTLDDFRNSIHILIQ